MRRMLRLLVLASILGLWQILGFAQAVTTHNGIVEILGTGVDSLDVAEGLRIGTDNVELVGIDGRLNGPLSPTNLDNLSVVNFTGFLGDVTGSGGATIVGNDSHTHNDTTIDGLDASAITTGSFGPTRLDALAGDVTGEINATVVGNNSHTHGDSTIDGLNASATTAGTFTAARIPNPAGDVTGLFSATVVGDNSHNHGDSTINGLDASAITTGSFGPTRLDALAGDVSGEINATVVANDSHTHDTLYGRLNTAETISGVWTFSEAPDFSDTAPATPDIQRIYKENVIKAWATVTNNGTTASLSDDYNMSAASRTGPGRVTVDFDQNMPNTTYAIVGMVGPEGQNVGGTVHVVAKGLGSVDLYTSRWDDLENIDFDCDFMIIVVGE